MTVRCIHIFVAWLLVASVFCRADAGARTDLTAAEYRAELDQLLAATQQLDSSGRPVPPLLKQLPPSWRISRPFCRRRSRISEVMSSMLIAGLR